MSATAKSLDINNELAMYQQMKATSTTTDDSSSSPAHVSLRSHIVELLDHFTHTGPNGTHNILVTEVMGPNCNTMIEEVRSLTIIGHNAAGNEVQRREQSKGLPLTIAKSILKQVLLGLRGLHKRGIAHGDVQPRNILFAVRELEDVKEGTVAQKLNASSEHGHDAREYVDAELQPLFRAQDTEQAGGRGGGRAKGSRWDVLERFDGKQDLWAPRYRLLEEPLTESVDGECLRMKLADPGSGERLSSSLPTHTSALELTDAFQLFAPRIHQTAVSRLSHYKHRNRSYTYRSMRKSTPGFSAVCFSSFSRAKR